eukprot:1968531-Pyramimonas_sp.AAC.1
MRSSVLRVDDLGGCVSPLLVPPADVRERPGASFQRWQARRPLDRHADLPLHGVVWARAVRCCVCVCG